MNLDPSIKYRVTGPVIFGPREQTTDRIKIGDVVSVGTGIIDEDGDVWANDNWFIRASSLTPATESDDIQIPRADLPEVEDRGGASLLVDKYTYSSTASPRELRAEAVRRLAVAEFLERRESEAAAAEERRNKRRDELADKVCAKAFPGEAIPKYSYAGLRQSTRVAIDLWLDAEEEAK